ncbi:MAG TPA: fumarylacetoacetate hydrolase [Burkholderiales bacterium]|nr:fumarylacetoacetate hydrolase [Burkholderiales bacterium]
MTVAWWSGDAGAVCPSHERVNTILRFLEAKEPIRGLPAGLSMRDAECGRRRLVEKLEAHENRIVGYKAGLTSARMQAQLGATSPVRGVLLEKMLLTDGADVQFDFGARPVFEADLIVVVKDAAIHKAKTHVEVLRSLSMVVPFIELPDLLVAEGEKLSAPLLVSLNVGARLGVVGKGIPVQATPDFAEALAAMRVTVTDRGGKELAGGTGTAILDHPLNAVLWLAQDLEKSRIQLKAGDLLSLGSFTAPLTPRPGLVVTVRYDGLPGNPAVSVRFR